MAKTLEIQSSTTEFLISQIKEHESAVQVLYHDETIQCTQKAMAELFDIGYPDDDGGLS